MKRDAKGSRFRSLPDVPTCFAFLVFFFCRTLIAARKHRVMTDGDDGFHCEILSAIKSAFLDGIILYNTDGIGRTDFLSVLFGHWRINLDYLYVKRDYSVILLCSF